MPFYLSGFLIGRVLGQREGIVDQSSLNRVALVGALVGPSATGLIVTSVVARREGESIQPISPAPPVQLVDVPDVRNSTRDSASRIVESLGLVVALQEVVSTLDPGTVTDQDPAPRTLVAPGSTVTLFVSKEPAGDTLVPVPDVTGQPFADARETLQDEDFKITKKLKPSDDHAKDTVIETVPPANTRVEPESRVTVIVSSGPPVPQERQRRTPG
jgi:hypothetical protein